MFNSLLEILKWSLSHIITWVCLNCLIAGAYWFYGQYYELCRPKVQLEVGPNGAANDDIEYRFDGLSEKQLREIARNVDKLLKAG